MNQIMERRSTDLGNSSVIYDIKTGFDFHNLNIIAINLANVLFDQDISRWIKLIERKIKIEPDHTAIIIVPEISERELNRLHRKFWKKILALVLKSEIGTFLKNTLESSVVSSVFLNPIAMYTIPRRVLKLSVKKIASNLDKSVLIRT